MVPVSGGANPTVSNADPVAQLLLLNSMAPQQSQSYIQQLQQQNLLNQILALQGASQSDALRYLQQLQNSSTGITDVEQLRQQAALQNQPTTSSGAVASTSASTSHLTVDINLVNSNVPKSSSAMTTPKKEVEDYSSEVAQLAAQKSSVSDQLEATEKNIKKSETQIEMLTKRRERLTQMAQESDDPEDDITDEPEDELQAVPLYQQIIDENKKRKHDIEMSFPPHLRIPENVTPLYLEPCDVPGMRELVIRHREFAPKLRQRLWAKKLQERASQEKYEVEYKKKYDEWLHKDQELLQRPERIARENRWRLVFEATFKELSKQRGDKERQTRIEGRNGAEFLSVPADEVDAEKKKRNAAVIPPMMNCQQGYRMGKPFNNLNLIHKNVGAKEKRRINDFEGTWSEQDLAMFKNRLRIVGKNFANIAMFFPDKSVKDCVQCYYLLIKKYNKEYKSMLPKTKRNIKKKYKPPIMPTPAELAKYHQDAGAENPRGAPIVPDVRCSKCQQKLDPTQNSVRVTRAFADTYGKSDKKVVDVQICSKCYEAEQKLRSGRCLVKSCFASNKKLKPTKVLPARWKQMDDRQKAFAHHDLGIPRDVTKTCHNCNKKIVKRVEEILAGELDQSIHEFESNTAWEDDEVARLLNFVEVMGTDDWDGIADQMSGRDAEECRLQWASSRKSSPDSDEEDEEVEENDARENGVEEVIIDDETQDIPEDDIAKDRESAPIIDLSPEPMDTAPGPSVIATNESTVPVIAAAETSLKSGSITAGTPMRPSSVTILETVSAVQPGPSNINNSQQLPGTAPPQSTSARETPQNAAYTNTVNHIKTNFNNQEDQRKLLQALHNGMAQSSINPSNLFAEVLLSSQATSLPSSVLEHLQKMENHKQLQQQVQQQADAQRAAALQQIVLQQMLNMKQLAQTPEDMSRILLLNSTAHETSQQLLAQKLQLQLQQKASMEPSEIFTRYEAAIQEIETAINRNKSERLAYFLQHLNNSEAQQAILRFVMTIHSAVTESHTKFVVCKGQLEQYTRKLEEEKNQLCNKESVYQQRLDVAQRELNTANASLQQWQSQIQQLANPNSTQYANNMQQMYALLMNSYQHAIQQASNTAVLAQQKVTECNNEIAAVRTRRQKITQMMTACEEQLKKGQGIPTDSRELQHAIQKQVYQEQQTMAQQAMAQQLLQRQSMIPPTTLAQMQQQHQLALFQLQVQQQAALQAQQQAQQAAAVQKLVQAPVRKDNTWVAELEKQPKASLQQQKANTLSAIGKKVIIEELATQQMVSPGGQQAVQQQSQQSSKEEPIKRKSGLETVCRVEKAPNVRHHQLHGSRRSASPMTQVPQKTPTSRSITGTATTSTTGQAAASEHAQNFAVSVDDTREGEGEQFASEPGQVMAMNTYQLANEFVSGLRLPTWEQQILVSGPPKDPEVVRKQGVAYAPGKGPDTTKSGEPNTLTGFPFVVQPNTLDRPGSATRSELGVTQQQQNLVSPGLKVSPRMTRDNVPTTSVGDVAPGVQHKPGMANGLLGEIEPMSPDSPKNAASPATLGGEAPRATSAEPRIYSMMDDVFFEDDGPLFRPISPGSNKYPGDFQDGPFEDISDEELANLPRDMQTSHNEWQQ